MVPRMGTLIPSPTPVNLPDLWWGAEMAITALGNINKTPGLPGLTDGVTTTLSMLPISKLFSGEMIKAYEASCIAKETVQNRTLRTVAASSSSTLDAWRLITISLVPRSLVLRTSCGWEDDRDGWPAGQFAFVDSLTKFLSHYSLRSRDRQQDWLRSGRSLWQESVPYYRQVGSKLLPHHRISWSWARWFCDQAGCWQWVQRSSSRRRILRGSLNPRWEERALWGRTAVLPHVSTTPWSLRSIATSWTVTTVTPRVAWTAVKVCTKSLASTSVVATTCPSWLVPWLARMVRTTITLVTSALAVVSSISATLPLSSKVSVLLSKPVRMQTMYQGDLVVGRVAMGAGPCCSYRTAGCWWRSSNDGF